MRRTAGVASAAAAIALVASVALAAEPDPPAPLVARLDPLAVARSVEAAVQSAVDRVAPAVVCIVVTREPGARPAVSETLPEHLQDLLEQYLRETPLPPSDMSNGAGVVISGDGHILTADHVVRDAAKIEVILSTRKRYPGRIVGADPRSYLAVVAITAEGLPVAQLGDASKVKRGQFVVALGSPFGFGRDGQASLSFGIVSGTGRAISGIGSRLDRYYGDLVQTDAPINPGNSGGPLVTLEGRVIGISAVISSHDGAGDGVGFAVPINGRTRSIIERLRKGEAIEYGFLGVQIAEVTGSLASVLGAEPGEGAVVTMVLPDTPAETAGLEDGDVVLSVDGRPVRGPDDLVQTVQATPVGGKVALEFLRGGERRTATVEVTRRPEPALARHDQRPWWRGMRVVPLTEELRAQGGLAPAKQGVFVSEVRDASPAAQAGVLPGIIVDQVGTKPVASVREFLEATEGVEGPCFVHVVGVGVKVIEPSASDSQ